MADSARSAPVTTSAPVTRRMVKVAAGVVAVAVTLATAAYRAGKHSGQAGHGVGDTDGLGSFEQGPELDW